MWKTIKEEYEALETEPDPEKRKSSERSRLLKKPLYDAMKEAASAEEDFNKKNELSQTAAAGTDETVKRTTIVARDEAEARLKMLNDAAPRVESAGELKGEQELELKTALSDIYKQETALREANESDNKPLAETARINLEVAKARWRNANEALQAIGTKDSVASLEVDGIKTMKTTVKGHLNSIDREIAALREELGSTGAGLANAPNVVTGVSQEKRTHSCR